MQGGDLHDALHSTHQITWGTGGRQLAAQIAMGLHELHLQRVSFPLGLVMLGSDQ